MTHQPRTAVYTGSRNLYEHMVPAAKSLLCNSDVERIVLLIEDDVFPEPLPDCFDVRNVSQQEYFWTFGPNYTGPFTYLAMMRAALAQIFPELDRIVALDVDTIACGPCSQLWTLPIGDNLIAAAREYAYGANHPDPYYNAGVTVQNLSALRASGMDAALIRDLNTTYRPFVEQDSYNVLFPERIMELPPEYNACMFNQSPVPQESIRIRHFAAEHDHRWTQDPSYLHYKTMPWFQVMLEHYKHFPKGATFA